MAVTTMLSRIWRLGLPRGSCAASAWQQKRVMSLLRQAAHQAPCLPAMDAARQATSRPESGDYSSYWFGPALAAAVAAGAFGDSPDSHASAVIHCMNVNGVSAGLVSARELPDIRGQQPDRLPPGEVGGPQVQVEDVGAIRHRHRRGSGPPPADHQPAATNPDEPMAGSHGRTRIRPRVGSSETYTTLSAPLVCRGPQKGMPIRTAPEKNFSQQ